MSIRAAFVDSSRSLEGLLTSPRLAERWSEPSALAEFTTSGLAGHLVRAVTATVDMLAQPLPDLAPISALDYFVVATASWSDNAEAIRTRGENEAAAGLDQLLERYREAVERLDRVLSGAPVDQLAPRGGHVVTLDDFLVIRALELLVHADDLAATLELPPPAFGPEITRPVISLLVDTAVARHGEMAVLVALTRRERDTVSALRVI